MAASHVLLLIASVARLQHVFNALRAFIWRLIYPVCLAIPTARVAHRSSAIGALMVSLYKQMETVYQSEEESAHYTSMANSSYAEQVA